MVVETVGQEATLIGMNWNRFVSLLGRSLLGRPCGTLHSVTHSRFSEYVRRVLGVVAQFPSQVLDEGSQYSGVVSRLGSPNSSHELAVSQYYSCVEGKFTKQPVLSGS